MNLEIANNVSVYIEILNNINLNFLKLRKLNGDDFIYKLERIVFDIVSDITRIIPIKQDKNKTLYLVNSDGILNFRNEFPYIETAYIKILIENIGLLQTIRQLRNKIEHKPHAIKFRSSVLGEESTDYIISFNVEIDNQIKHLVLKSDKIIGIIYKVNIEFDKIVKEICNFAENNELTDYPYYKYLKNVNFIAFNNIYDEEKIR